MVYSYTDIAYPQSVTSPKIVPEFEAHFTDPTAISGANSQQDSSSGMFDGGFHNINSSGSATPFSLTFENVSGVDPSGNVITFASGYLPFLRPRVDFNTNLNIPRVSGLSNAYESIIQDFIFGKYIHCMPNPSGGRGLLDITSYAVETDVTYSRNINILTYSPYN